jgi:hypothetical protein
MLQTTTEVTTAATMTEVTTAATEMAHPDIGSALDSIRNEKVGMEETGDVRFSADVLLESGMRTPPGTSESHSNLRGIPGHLSSELQQKKSAGHRKVPSSGSAFSNSRLAAVYGADSDNLMPQATDLGSMVGSASGFEPSRRGSDIDGTSYAGGDYAAQLEDLKIKTMYNLVEDITIDVQGESMEKKLLFLSNKQARKFNFENMGKLMEAMDIGQPKLVINLLGTSSPYAL